MWIDVFLDIFPNVDLGRRKAKIIFGDRYRPFFRDPYLILEGRWGFPLPLFQWAKDSKHHITHGKGNHNEHDVGVMQQSFAVCFNLCRGCQGLNQKILLFYAACIVYAAKVYLLCGIKCSILAAFGQPAGWQICLLNPGISNNLVDRWCKVTANFTTRPPRSMRCLMLDAD